MIIYVSQFFSRLVEKYTHKRLRKITTSIFEFTIRKLTSFERLTVTGAGPFYIRRYYNKYAIEKVRTFKYLNFEFISHSQKKI